MPSGDGGRAAPPALPFEAIFLASPLPVSVSHLSDGRLVAVNDAWLREAGLSRESVIGRTSVELGFWPSEKERQAFVDALGQAPQVYTLRQRSGQWARVRVHGARIDAEPQPLMLAFALEITREADAELARQQTEQALQAANRALEQRFELHHVVEKLARVGHWTNAEDDELVRWSPGLYEMTGLSPEQPLLRSELGRYVHPDDHATWWEARAACDEREIDFRWLHPDGRVRWLRTRMGRTSVAGNPQTEFGVVQDITAERDARERLSEQLALLQNIAARVPGLMYRARLRPDGRSVISYVNDRATEMLEVTPGELQADARALFKRVHPDDLDEVKASLSHSARTLSVWRQTYRVRLSGGRVRWYRVEAAPQTEADGSVVWHGFTTDVSEARRAAQQLERQHRMLEAVRRAQSIFIETDDKRSAFEGLLAAFLELTGSGYGFVGEVHFHEDGTPYLRCHAITNIAWDEASRRKYEDQSDAGMVFDNLRSLMGAALVTGQPVIANAPANDPRAGGLPPGHPALDAFLGVPLAVGDQLVAMVGLANQPGGFHADDIEFLQPLLGAVRQLVLAWRGHAERKRTRAALEAATRQLTEKSETLQATLDSISQGLTKIDASGRIVVYNRRVLELLNLPGHLLARQPTHEQVVRFQRERGDFGEGMALVDPAARNNFVHLGSTNSPDNYWRKTSDGRTLEVRMRHLPDGSQVRTFSDVTSYIEAQDALREERQRLAWVLEATRPGIWETNLDTGELTVDERWADMLGYRVADLAPVSLQTWTGLVHPDDLQRAHGDLMDHWMGKTPFVDIDIRLRHRDGHWVWINKRGRVHERDTQGCGRFMSGTQLDISERVAAQEEVLALNATLEQRVGERTAALERSLRDMEAISYSIAHDLRAPLRAVNGFSALIAEEADTPLGPVASDMFGRINVASRRMGQMLTDMLELLRVVRVDLEAVPVDLHRLAHRLADDLAHESPRAEIAVSHLPPVLGDATLLRQMLHNLMENGLKYARHRETPRLTLHFDEAQDAFCLRDNGSGFDMAHAGKLFGLFQRLHASTEVPGTGVGLAIVARIIERHGGRIWAEAEPDAGASFWWTLPRA